MSDRVDAVTIQAAMSHSLHERGIDLGEADDFEIVDGWFDHLNLDGESIAATLEGLSLRMALQMVSGKVSPRAALTGMATAAFLAGYETALYVRGQDASPGGE